MTKVFHRNFFLDGPAGRLEASLWTSPNPNAAMAAVVCHPHPLYAGTMHNKVVFNTAKALQRMEWPVLRFNFRGAGMSEGQHDKGRGEQDDVRAALDFLAAEYPGRPLLLAGFSFGSVVGLRVGCEDARVTKLIGLGLPVNGSDVSFLNDCRKPKLFIHGGNDEHGDAQKLRELFETWPEPKKLVIVEGADHFFAGKLDAVGEAVRDWLG